MTTFERQIMKGCNLDGLEIHTWKSMCIDMFGEHHKAVIGELAGVGKRTVQRWYSGELEPPAWVIAAINDTYEIWGQCPTCGEYHDNDIPISCQTGDGE